MPFHTEGWNRFDLRKESSGSLRGVFSNNSAFFDPVTLWSKVIF